ncbi:hypothetical protein [Cupriavidus gilardii]|jgi:hypothetical protein|uniref:hypothetical protein n=1 Tax=Cupriavidus gilardii TaxID=82541 RepID=UPI001580F334|nr:hypothetical protein [Cupriavidus gilardii]MCT9073500.1 hypothetical protein [Cupriavidus gilardii]QKS61484.1 hypothetical protein FOB47_06320 [Cupriavidus gilardii]
MAALVEPHKEGKVIKVLTGAIVQDILVPDDEADETVQITVRGDQPVDGCADVLAASGCRRCAVSH